MTILSTENGSYFLENEVDFSRMVDDLHGYDFRLAFEDIFKSAINEKADDIAQEYFEDMEIERDHFRRTLVDLRLELEGLQDLLNAKRLNRDKIKDVTNLIHDMIDNEL